MGVFDVMWGRAALVLAVLFIVGAMAGAGCVEHDTRSQPVTGAMNAGSGADARSCSSDLQCDPAGGYACLSIARQPERFDGDAGAEQSDGGEARALGVCASSCETERCVDPHFVCNARVGGGCHEGCDAQRPACGADAICDFSAKHCVRTDGHCTDVSDCGLFDARLKELGSLACMEQRCHFVPSSLEPKVHKIAPITTEVQQPSANQRIPKERANEFVFQFDVGAAPVAVAVITTSPETTLAKLTRMAIWAAFTDADRARDGIVLADGGRMSLGIWHPDTVELPANQPLYFIAMGYDGGELVTASTVIPFVVATPLLSPGAPCNLNDGEFCERGSTLQCSGGQCLRPCASAADCELYSRCGLPSKGVQARLCFRVENDAPISGEGT